jgi:GNAT superfamily N-acetyltransferase
MHRELTIQSIDLRTIDGVQAEQLSRFWNAIRLEHIPEDPPIPLEERLHGWHNLPAFEELQLWAVSSAYQEEVLATCEATTWKTEDNQHLMFFEIDVAPAQRRQGLGRQMLHLAVQSAQERGRRLMMSETSQNIPAGAAFLERIGAQRGLETHSNQLKLEEIDRDLLSLWLGNSNGHYEAFTLGFWDGSYPEEQIEGVLDLFKIVNDEPHDDLEMEDFKFTREQLRQMEKHDQARGTQRWTVYLEEKATGKFCGFSEVFWNPNRPKLLYQGFTGVNPAHRGNGLGRWMKAAMIERVLHERPQVRVVRTGNANSNRYMLAINSELGFKPHMAWTVWQIETEKAKTYLTA